MPRDVKLTYLKKAKKFLDKNPRLITENEIDILVGQVDTKGFFKPRYQRRRKAASRRFKKLLPH